MKLEPEDFQPIVEDFRQVVREELKAVVGKERREAIVAISGGQWDLPRHFSSPNLNWGATSRGGGRPAQSI